MATVTLDFRPPTDPDISVLHVYEAPTSDGPWDEIDTVTPVGTYPTYITRYTTQNASDPKNWFAIEWESTLGAKSGLSEPLQGGFDPLLSEIVNRVLLRDSSLDENIVAQEAEAVVEGFFPLEELSSIPANEATARQLSGFTLLTMARAYLSEILKQSAGVSGNVQSFTAGLVQISSGTTAGSGKTTSIDMIEKIIENANSLLGRSYSYIVLLEEIAVAGGYKQLDFSMDESRLIFEIG
jgi:hypothetical protein